jgi:hypothetical protein
MQPGGSLPRSQKPGCFPCPGLDQSTVPYPVYWRYVSIYEVLPTVHLSIFIVLLTVHLSIFITVFNQLHALDLFYSKFHFMPVLVSSTCAHHQEAKIILYSIWNHHTYRWPYNTILTS